jgi:hypothetical protein
MARKAKKKASKRQMSTEWGVGQPLAFPSKKSASSINRLAQEVVEKGMRGPFSPKGKSARRNSYPVLAHPSA